MSKAKTTTKSKTTKSKNKPTTSKTDKPMPKAKTTTKPETTNKKKTSTDLSAEEAIEHIQNTSKADLKGFVPDSEERTTVLDAHEKATVSMAKRARTILTPLIEKGDKTRKELKEVLVGEDITEATADVILSDSKNPKYNQFEKLVVENKEGKYSFK